MTYEINGDKWKITYVSSTYPDQPMVYDIEIGKPFDGKAPDGSDVKVCIICDRQRLCIMFGCVIYLVVLVERSFRLTKYVFKQ